MSDFGSVDRRFGFELRLGPNLGDVDGPLKSPFPNLLIPDSDKEISLYEWVVT